jgi:isopentenyldiphosphate isomerase
MTEILDIYDDQMRHIGTKERGAVHRDGDWHKVFQCWVVYRDADGRDYLVVQRRGPDKDIYPNYLDISAAGHYQAGETIRDGIREVQEELGIQVSFDDLIPLGVRIGMRMLFCSSTTRTLRPTSIRRKKYRGWWRFL